MQTTAISRDAAGIAPLNKSQPRETDKVYLITTAEGKHHEIQAKTIRVIPDAMGFNTVKALDGGVWEPVFTSPFAFEITLVSPGGRS